MGSNDNQRSAGTSQQLLQSLVAQCQKHGLEVHAELTFGDGHNKKKYKVTRCLPGTVISSIFYDSMTEMERRLLCKDMRNAVRKADDLIKEEERVEKEEIEEAENQKELSECRRKLQRAGWETDAVMSEMNIQ